MAYLKSIPPQILKLNGDIIDGWQFSKRHFPDAHMQVIKEIISLLTYSTRVICITGNHDEMLSRYSDIGKWLKTKNPIHINYYQSIPRVLEHLFRVHENMKKGYPAKVLEVQAA